MRRKNVQKGRRMIPSAPSEIAAFDDESAAGNSRLTDNRFYSALSFFANGFTGLKNPVIAVALIFGVVCIAWVLADRDGDVVFACSFQDGCYVRMLGDSTQKYTEKRVEKPSDDSGKVPEKVPKSDSAK